MRIKRLFLFLCFIILLWIILILMSLFGHNSRNKYEWSYKLGEINFVKFIIKNTKPMMYPKPKFRNLNTYNKIINLSVLTSDIHTFDIWDIIMDPDDESLSETIQLKDIKGKLKIFIVPHSHHDPDWLKTFEEYYREDVKSTLDSMLNFLYNNINVTFIYAEISFFQEWFKSLRSKDIAKLKTIILRNQLEIVTGGWVVNDEANCHFYSIITQLTEGHRWLKEKLNYTPRNAWSIDPFGYSQSMTYLLKKAGIKNLVINRVHYLVKHTLIKKKSVEFQWIQNWDQNSLHSMPTHMLPYVHYDILQSCGPDSIVCCQFDFVRIENYSCSEKAPVPINENNIKERSKLLLEQYLQKAALYSNGYNLLVPLGDDLRYLSTKEWNIQISNYKKLINYINENFKNVEIKFGTLSDYFNSIGEDKLSNMSTLTGDLFTYADLPDNYWSGYFTSRPLIKILDKILHSALRTAEISHSIAFLFNKKYKVKVPKMYKMHIYDILERARGIFSLTQHHDTITGTSVESVMLNSENRILNALENVHLSFKYASQNILDKRHKIVEDYILFDVEDIISGYGERFSKNIINFNEKSVRYIYLFNSLAHSREVVVDIPIELDSNYRIKVFNSRNLLLKCQTSPMESVKSLNIYFNRHTLSFKLTITPLTYEQIKIMLVSKSEKYSTCKPVSITSYKDSGVEFSDIYEVNFEKSERNIVLENDLNKVGISPTTGHIQWVQNVLFDEIRQNYSLDVYFKYYRSSEIVKSGAYLFSPDGTENIYEDNPSELFLFNGEIYNKVMIVKPVLITYFTLHKVEDILSNIIDVKNVVDISKQNDFELSMVVATDAVQSNNIFYTDSNCFQYVIRKKIKTLPFPASVFPSICGSFIENENMKLTVLTGQPNGVTGGNDQNDTKKSFIEYFLDRASNQDDGKGLGEGIIDNEPVEKRFRINLEPLQNDHQLKSMKTEAKYLNTLTINEQQLLNDLHSPVEKLFVKSSFNEEVKSYFAVQKRLMTGLPCDYQMVTLRTNLNDDSPNILLQRYLRNYKSKYIGKSFCQHTNNNTPLYESLFNNFKLKSVQKSLITSINVSSVLHRPESISMSQMEIDNFKLNFE